MHTHASVHTSKMMLAAAAAAKSIQSCPTLCDPIDGSPPGSPIPGILQARTLEWIKMMLRCRQLEGQERIIDHTYHGGRAVFLRKVPGAQRG